MDRSDLFARFDPAHFRYTERPSFDLFILTESEGWSHTVDFEPIAARQGRLLRIRAGQAQAWDERADRQATLVLSAPGMSTPQPWFPGDPAAADLAGPALATARAAIDSLVHQQDNFDGDTATVRLMVALFDVLVALFDQAVAGAGAQGDAAPSEGGAEVSPIYLAYRSAIEQDLHRHRDVAHYADRLGYSERTLTRACRRATGQTAKDVLLDRMVLEAKRLLAQTDDPIVNVSTRLGFSEATNFTKFFVRHTAETPTAFRRQHLQGDLRA
jgi:AraC-like DNA-binding protein